MKYDIIVFDLLPYANCELERIVDKNICTFVKSQLESVENSVMIYTFKNVNQVALNQGH